MRASSRFETMTTAVISGKFAATRYSAVAGSKQAARRIVLVFLTLVHAI